MFKEIKNRDAWSAIRGFVYQVDITILKWIELQDNEFLELEKGEDIDVVTQFVTEESENARELEQVKYRESTISLNKDIVLENLLNFYLHRTNNPDKKIFFKFMTNAGWNMERPAIFSSGKSGIEVWKELSETKSLDASDDRLVILKTHLLKKLEIKINNNLGEKGTKKEKSIGNNWRGFKAHISKDKDLIQFIKDFKWSLKNDDAVGISNTI